MPLTHAISRSTWYMLGVIYASMLALAVASVLWSAHLAEQSNRQWCGVLGVFHDAYASNPVPPTERGRDIQTQLESLYRDFDCASVPRP